VQEYAGGRGGETRGSSHREPLIAIAGTDEGGLPLRSEREQAVCAKLRERSQPSIGPAKRLEAAEHATALILGKHLRDSEPPRQRGKVTRGVAG
jgi:hypothetical protein